MISGSLLYDRADEHNQLLDEFVASMESKEHKQMEDLAGIQAQHHGHQLRKELSMVAQDNDAKHGVFEFATGGLPRRQTSILCLRQRFGLETESIPVGEVYG